MPYFGENIQLAELSPEERALMALERELVRSLFDRMKRHFPDPVPTEGPDAKSTMFDSPKRTDPKMDNGSQVEQDGRPLFVRTWLKRIVVRGADYPEAISVMTDDALIGSSGIPYRASGPRTHITIDSEGGVEDVPGFEPTWTVRQRLGYLLVADETLARYDGVPVGNEMPGHDLGVLAVARVA